MIYHSKTESDTFNFAYNLAERIKPGDILLINGELGVGKTVFVRGLASALGINEPMPSPSFTIVNEYKGRFTVYHFDFYRINDPYELYEIGFEDYIYSDAVTFIEWPSKALNLLPLNTIKVDIKIIGKEREISIVWKK